MGGGVLGGAGLEAGEGEGGVLVAEAGPVHRNLVLLLLGGRRAQVDGAHSPQLRHLAHCAATRYNNIALCHGTYH